MGHSLPKYKPKQSILHGCFYGIYIYRFFLFLSAMNVPIYRPRTIEEAAVYALYEQLLQCWNAKNAEGMANLFATSGYIVGFDGSEMTGPSDIAAQLKPIFADHPTARYFWKVREMRTLAPQIIFLRAVVGMVPPGKSQINPATNAIQSLIARKYDEVWKIELYQNTPAQFHGRPGMVEALTAELNELLK
jgi:uncharacterized protein (TIGR02246 family)